jgi:polyhydroxyalkanoic acid synthase PhaR subunit
VPEPPGTDPFAAWRDLVAQWEKSVNAAANRTMGTDEFSSTMHGGMALTLKMQEALRDVMTAYLANVNLPSRTDVAALSERIGAIEARLDTIASALERIAAAHDVATARGAPPVPAPRPPRTKRPPGAEPPGTEPRA